LPASGLLALLDDVATIADDVATLTLTAGRKTSALVTDDLAVSAEQTLGLRRERELPVVWAIAQGSLRNKLLFLAPGALALTAVAPWLVGPLLLWGGGFLCYEGSEKLLAKRGAAEDVGADAALADPEAFEAARVAGAIRTDVVLSAEVMAITLGEIAAASFVRQVFVLLAVSVGMTVAVYGVVAVLVKLDDLAEVLAGLDGTRTLGRALLRILPTLMRSLSWIGLVAMWLVGGHLLVHGLPALHHLVEVLVHPLPGVFGAVATTAADLLVGAATGFAAVGVSASGLPARLASLLPRWLRTSAV
jgi:predicted DNA repair protein MutK